MKFEQGSDESVTLRLTRNELGILNNCLNEALEALDDDEFSVRVGASASEVEELLTEFRRLIARRRQGPRSATA